MPNKKIEGKHLEFWLDGIEEPIISQSLTEAFDQLESTDSATAGDGKDFEVGRATRSFTLEANLYTPVGAELTTGTLVKDNTYRVTGGTMVEGTESYELGRIFVSDGTGVATGTNKVVPLGDKISGKTMNLNYDGVDMPLSSADISIKYDTIDATDTATVGDASEVLVSRADRESKVSAILRDDDVDILSEDPLPVEATLEFAPGQTIDGIILPVNKTVGDEVNGMAKVDYTFKWKGQPTETALGFATAVEKPFIIRLMRGVTTHKQYSGTCIITEKSITNEVKGLAKVSYSCQIQGELTRAVAN